MASKIKPVKAWAVVSHGQICPGHISTSREYASDRCMCEGDNVIRVLITPIEPAKKAKKGGRKC